MINDTIAAIATGLTNAGISIIRISGPDSLSIASKIFKKKKNDVLEAFDAIKADSHTVHYGFIVDEEDIVDEVMMLVLKAPSTYTREDVIEIDCHGGIVVTKKVLDTVLKNGARTAEPGEFTKRAFLNGRIDLSRAEAVIDIINSKNKYALNNSLKQLSGMEHTSINAVREQILSDTAFIEAALDDPEHIDIDGFSSTLYEHVKTSDSVLMKLIASADNGRLMSEGINTVIVGKPNAGKSTLLNSLLGEERAIVTDIAGTTRDTLEETAVVDGVTLNIIDTAGIRQTEDTVEKIGVKRALEALDMADLVLYVVDASKELDDNDLEIIEKIENRQCIVLLNKTDMPNGLSSDAYKALNAKEIEISAKCGNGLDELASAIKEMFFKGDLIPNDEIYITSLRHLECLRAAHASLVAVLRSIENQMSEDFFTIDLLNAYQSLGQIIGEDMDEDLINKIFKDFCMGK